MGIPTEAILAIQILCGLLTALALWLLKQMADKLEENTKSTHSIAVNSGKTDTKVDLLTSRVETISERTHKTAQDVTELMAYEKMRQKPGKRVGHGG